MEKDRVLVSAGRFPGSSWQSKNFWDRLGGGNSRASLDEGRNPGPAWGGVILGENGAGSLWSSLGKRKNSGLTWVVVILS